MRVSATADAKTKGKTRAILIIKARVVLGPRYHRPKLKVDYSITSVLRIRNGKNEWTKGGIEINDLRRVLH